MAQQCDSIAKTIDESESQIGSSQQLANHDQLSSESISEASTVTSTVNAAGIPTTKTQGSFHLTSLEANDGSNGATRLTLSDTLTDGGTTVVSSTLPISTPSSRAQNTEHGSSEVVTHHGSVHAADAIDGIPKNILSFPQTPPIMMYRPVSTGPVTSSPAREGKYTDGGRKAKFSSMTGVRKSKGSSLGHKKQKEHKKSQQKAIPDDGHAFGYDRKPTVAIASDALPKVFPIDSSRENGKSHDQSLEEANGNNDKITQDQAQKTALEQQQFGGYGYGMIHEPDRQAAGSMRNKDRDVPQHYIITSSGHVEMFDDSGAMGGPEVGTENQEVHVPDADGFEKQQYRDVLSFDGRVSSRVAQNQPSNGSNGEDSEDTDSEEDDTEEDDSGAIAPAIMLTTNVTQG
uniref:Uncharacterized protein n=1 Tax=Anopheles maculatus TaxID=74869 RepID=A0A182TB01_9DIPT